MADQESAEQKAAREAAEAAEAEQAAADEARASGPEKARKAQEDNAKRLRKEADDARKNPNMSRDERWHADYAAIMAEHALRPRDEFTEKPPAFVVDGMKVGPNGRPIGKDGREAPGPVTEWMPVPTH